MWCSRGCLGTPAISDACLCHGSIAGGARRRGCAAGGVPVFFSGLLNTEAAVHAQDVAGDEAAAGAEQEEHGLVELAGAAAARERRALEQERREGLRIVAELGGHLGGEEAGS